MMFSGHVSGVNTLNVVPECISMNNEECKIRPEVINISSNELLFYTYIIKVKLNTVAVVIMLMIQIQNHAFLMLVRTWILKYLI